MLHSLTATDPPQLESPGLHELLAAQRRSFIAEGPPPLAVRLNRIDRLLAAVLDNTDAFIGALGADFGSRPAAATLATDLVASLADIRYTRRNAGRWMRARRVNPGLMRVAGVKTWIEPTPLGVVGVIAPWNVPLTLAVQPAVAALAAGNRVMLKMSEIAPRTAELLRAAVAERFATEELLVVTGGPEVGHEFAGLPLDHLFFTGAPSVGRSCNVPPPRTSSRSHWSSAARTRRSSHATPT
jgi:coniferyl-aldehyde dehydrogenase